jgi:hypothetical protein
MSSLDSPTPILRSLSYFFTTVRSILSSPGGSARIPTVALRRKKKDTHAIMVCGETRNSQTIRGRVTARNTLA